MTLPPSSLRRWLPLAAVVLGAVLGAVYLREHLSFEALRDNRQALLAFRDAHPVFTPLLFMLAYVVIVAFSLPGAAIASLTGGFLFALFPGVVYNVLAATTGAMVVFLAIRAGLGEVFARGDVPDLGIIFQPFVLGPLLGLAALSLLPVALKRLKRT